MRGSRICTVNVLPPLIVRSARVSDAAWRPQPIASAGHGGARCQRMFFGTPRRIALTKRGANVRHGPRSFTVSSIACTRIAPASARA